MAENMFSSNVPDGSKIVSGVKGTIREWNQLRDEFGKLDANWSPEVAGRLVELRHEMAAITNLCIAMYATSEFVDPATAIKSWSGQSLKKALNKKYDNEALTALLGRIVLTIRTSYKQILETFEGANKQPLGKDEIDLHENVSAAIWRFLSAFWEVGTIRALGDPENVWVAANIRDTLAGYIFQEMTKMGYEDVDGDEIYSGFASFVEEYRSNIANYFEGEESRLGGVFAFVVFPNSDKSEIRGAALDQAFASFTQQFQNMPKQQIDGI